MSYEEDRDQLINTLEGEVASLTGALLKAREENEELIEENARLVAENEEVGRENSVLKQQLDETRGPY
jgi:regulator of replication initiation timing